MLVQRGGLPHKHFSCTAAPIFRYGIFLSTWLKRNFAIIGLQKSDLLLLTGFFNGRASYFPATRMWEFCIDLMCLLTPRKILIRTYHKSGRNQSTFQIQF